MWKTLDLQNQLSPVTTLSEAEQRCVLAIDKPFSSTDKVRIAAIAAILPGLSLLFGKHCELVLHSLEHPDASVVAAVHSEISERYESSPLSPTGLNFIADLVTTWRQEPAFMYRGKGLHGENIKSVVIPIYNEEGRCLGALSTGMNLDIPLSEIVEDLFLSKPTQEAPKDHSFSYGGGKKGYMYRTIFQEIKNAENKKVQQRDKVKYIIHELYKKNIFENKNAVSEVSDALLVKQATVYHHIRDIKAKEEKV